MIRTGILVRADIDRKQAEEAQEIAALNLAKYRLQPAHFLSDPSPIIVYPCHSLTD